MKQYYLVDGMIFDSIEAVIEYREGKQLNPPKGGF